MNFSFLFSVCLLVTKTTFVPVEAMPENYVVEAILNDGHLLPKGEMCTMDEWNSIVNAANNAFLDNRRRLQVRGSTGKPVGTPTALWCQKFCQKSKYCMTVGIGCTPRRLEASDSVTTASVVLTPIETVFQREAASAPTTNIVGELINAQCSNAISRVNAAFDAVGSTLSTDCQAILNSARNFTCYNVVEEEVPLTSCEIKGFALWNAASDTLVVPNFADGGSFCRKAFPFSIQALTDDCVGRVHFDLMGSNGYHKDQTEVVAPFFSAGNKGASILETKVKAGQYVLTVYPDEDVSLMKTLSFTVKNC